MRKVNASKVKKTINQFLKIYRSTKNNSKDQAIFSVEKYFKKNFPKPLDRRSKVCYNINRDRLTEVRPSLISVPLHS